MPQHCKWYTLFIKRHCLLAGLLTERVLSDDTTPFVAYILQTFRMY